MIENEMTVSVPLEVVKASEIEPKEVKWLWYPYIPFGKVTLLQGDPGDGKSKLMLSIAALLSKGEPLPFTETEENEPMTIIYQTTEDDADDTVVPRFNSAGGNGENLIFIKEDEKSFCNTEIRCCCKEESKSGNEEISPTMTDTARKRNLFFICVGLAVLHTLTFFVGVNLFLRRSTPMCNKNKITARKEETHAEVTDSQRRNAPL